MALLAGKPLRHLPSGVTDVIDDTNGPQGSMQALMNLVPDPSTVGVYVPRSPVTALVDLATSGFANAGFISAELVVGDIAYGMLSTSRNPGHDEPYCVNLKTGAVIPVAGVTSVNTPASPPPSGDWTPPIMAQVGGRIVVCHPGFPGGGTGVKVGWFDVSGFMETTTGDTNSGIGSGDFITGNPAILGVQPGMTISGPNIPAGTTVISTLPFSLTTTGATNTNVHLTGLASTNGVAVGQTVSGVGIPAGAVVTALVSPTAVDISPAATASSTVSITFGGATIKMSNYATAAADGQQITILGGASPISYPIVANTTAGSLTLDGDPTVNPQEVGQLISGPGIQAGTTVTSYGAFGLSTTGNTHVGLTLLDSLASTTGVVVGQAVEGIGIQGGTVVAALVSASSVTLSQPMISSNVGTAIHFTGTTLTLSQPATATATDVTLDVTGVPLWGAGDTDRNPLPTIPVAVAQYNGRAYYACGIFGIPFSDSGFAARMSNNTAVQVLLTNDGLPVTMIAPLMLSAPLTGGIVQSLIAFQGGNKMQQITGDLTTNNLTMNALPVATGTEAPLSCAPCSKGLAFVSPQGLRIVGFDGTVTDPIGEGGSGVTLPFIYSNVPSRMCAAANNNVIRITTENSAAVDLATQGGLDTGIPFPTTFQEWWYDLTRRIWTGPHTSSASLIQPWEKSFALTLVSSGGSKIFQSDSTPQFGVPFTELDLPMWFFYATSLLPDSGDMRMIKVVEMTLASSVPLQAIIAYALSDYIQQLDLPTPQAQFGSGVFGQALFGVGGVPIPPDPGDTVFRQRRVPWDQPLVFKQASIRVTGTLLDGLKLGNLYMRYQPLNYVLEDAA